MKNNWKEEFLQLWDNKEKQTPGWYIDFIESLLVKQKKELINEIKEEMEDIWNNDADRKGDWWKGFSFALDSVTVLLNKLKTHD